jgi:hypothetical protein
MATIPIPNVPEGTPLRNIADPSDVDVLSGRDAYVQRHKGNNAYRKLVNANKTQYITVRKPDKMKISRCIVAAVRIKGGRFLEKGKGGDQLWHDIGDKKAIEKTSQALREGQPKLKKEIVQGRTETPQVSGHEFVQLAATPEFPDSLLSQINPHSVCAMCVQPPVCTAEVAHHSTTGSIGDYAEPNGSLMADGAAALEPPMWSTGAVSESFPATTHDMPQLMDTNRGPPQSIPEGSFHSQSQFADVQNEYFVPQQQSTFEAPPYPTQSPAEVTTQYQQEQQQQPYVMKPPPMITPQSTEVGDPYEQPVHLDNEAPVSRSMFYSHAQQYETLESQQQQQQQQEQHHEMFQQQQQSIQEQFEPPQPQQQYSSPQKPPVQEQWERVPLGSSRSFDSTSNDSFIEAPHIRPPRQVDRRRIFARMKVSRPASGMMDVASSRSLDGMPDFYMVGSQFSLMSLGGNSKTGVSSSMVKDDLCLGSRRSLMSGISRISGASENPPPIFADMGKKIGNVSTRSIAMSEISGVEENVRTEELQELIDWEMKNPSEQPALKSKKNGEFSSRSIAMSEISGVEESVRTEDLQELIDWELKHPSERTMSAREII